MIIWLKNRRTNKICGANLATCKIISPLPQGAGSLIDWGDDFWIETEETPETISQIIREQQPPQEVDWT